MPYSVRILIAIVLCIALSGGLFFWAKRPSGSVIHAGVSAKSPGLAAELPAASIEALPDNASSTYKVDLPILVYHIVRPSYPGDDASVRALALTPQTFDAEMKYLGTAGYHVVQFSDLEDYFKIGKPLPPKPVILSFDDGWRDQFAYAFPILEKYRYAATFFVFTNSLGRRGFLSWHDLHTLIGAGMIIGSHTRSHPYLTRIADRAALWGEIDGSKVRLQKKLGITVNEFAYPFGAYNPAIVEMVRKAGYRSARGDFFSGGQSADRLYELSAMNAPTTTALFEEKFPVR